MGRNIQKGTADTLAPFGAERYAKIHYRSKRVHPFKRHWSIKCEEQSVYRALRKFYDLEIVDYEMRDGKSGPSRKYYFLTEIGRSLLKTFIERNIKIMYTNEITKLLLKKG